MLLYKHYSFDLWLTLIKSNPIFKKQRSLYFHKHYNSLSLKVEEVEHIFRRVDIMVNLINERTGKNIDADEMYLMVISWMNNNQFNLYDIDIKDLSHNMETLFFDYSPVLYCKDTAGVLGNLKERGATMNILSNTGFVNGLSLRKLLQQLGIYKYFDFQVYSDEVGVSKPNPVMFKIMIEQAMALSPISLQSIVHIGDNPKADIDGARAAGIHGILINSVQNSITDLNYETSHIFPS